MLNHFCKFDIRIADGKVAILLSVILHDRNSHFDDVVKTIRSLGTATK